MDETSFDELRQTLPLASIVTRRALLMNGVEKGTIDRRLRRGELRRLFGGIYLERNDERSAIDEWHAELVAHLERAHGNGVLSHRSAARLHGLEGVFGLPIDLTVPWDSGFSERPAIRSRTLRDADIVTIRGFPVTSLVRTLGDLGRFVSADTVEAALNSALRGFDRRKPADWNQDLLTDINRLCASPTTRRGIARLRVVTQRRGLVRPTGSYPETVLLMAARRQGLRLVPQVEVRLAGTKARGVTSLFPDFATEDGIVLVEVDGVEAHSGAERIDRDARRQNKLIVGFDVLRFQAGRVLADADACAAELASRLQQLRSAPDPRRSRVTIVDPWTFELRVTG